MPYTRRSRFEEELRIVQTRRRSVLRRMRAGWRDTWVLLREFREAIIFFGVTLLVGALSFRALWNLSQETGLGFFEAIYDVLTMVFFQPVLEFPDEWYLELFFFVMPLLGVIALTRGLTDFVVLLFNRRLRQNKWEEAVASTLGDHIIVCGLGHVGLRVVHELIVLDEDILVIEQDGDNPRLEAVREFDIPVIMGDARNIQTLNKAGLDKADALIVCTNDDLMNLQIASRVREISPTVRIVMRMFDEQFARSMGSHFDFAAVMSASSLAAPAFAGAAIDTEIMQTFKVDDKVLVMGRIQVREGAKLDGTIVEDVEEALDVSIVVHQSNNELDIHPDPEQLLAGGDVISVIGTLRQMKDLAYGWNRNRRPGP